MEANLLLKGTALILGLQWLSTALLRSLGSTFPAPLLGMLLLTVLLLTGIVRKESVSLVCRILIQKMGLLFLPAAVNILLYLHIIKAESRSILLTIIITSIVVLVTTTAFLEFALKHTGGKKS